MFGNLNEKHYQEFIQSMNARYVNGGWRQQNSNTKIFSKKYGAVLVIIKQRGRQLAASIKCMCCHGLQEIKVTVWCCHGDPSIFAPIISMCSLDTVRFILQTYSSEVFFAAGRWL